MKPNDQLQKSRLSLNKQTITKLDAVKMNAVHAGNAAATSIPCIVILSLTVSCSRCDAEN